MKQIIGNTLVLLVAAAALTAVEYGIATSISHAAEPPKLSVKMADVGSLVVPTMTFTLKPNKGPAPLAVKATWSSQGAQACVANGANGASGIWTGTKATAGTETVTITSNGKFVLTCNGQTPDVTLTWTIPTQNTDGTPLTNLAGFKLYHTTTAGGTPQATPIDIANPTQTTYTLQGLPTGMNYFAMQSYNTVGAVSSLTGEVTADVPAQAAAIQRWVTITAPPPPPPTDITVTVAPN